MLAGRFPALCLNIANDRQFTPLQHNPVDFLFQSLLLSLYQLPCFLLVICLNLPSWALNVKQSPFNYLRTADISFWLFLPTDS